MSTLKWLDFSKYNEANNAHVRAFAVNHPDYGRLIVLKGVPTSAEADVLAGAFTQTKDGSFVVQAPRINLTPLSRAFPGLTLTDTDLSHIDLTEQWVKSTPKEHPVWTWLTGVCSQRPGESASRFTGPVPSALSDSLLSFLRSQAQEQSIGEGVYRFEGLINKQHTRVDVLVAANGGYRIHALVDDAPLPAPTEKPALLIESERLQRALSGLSAIYGVAESGNAPSTVLPTEAFARSLGEHQEGDLLLNEYAIDHDRTLMLGYLDGSGLVLESDLRALLGETLHGQVLQTISALDSVRSGEQHWIKAEPLASSDLVLQWAKQAGFDLVAYHSDQYSRVLGNSDEPDRTLLTADDQLLCLSVASPEALSPRYSTPLLQPYRLPEGYQVDEHPDKTGAVIVTDADGEIVGYDEHPQGYWEPGEAWGAIERHLSATLGRSDVAEPESPAEPPLSESQHTSEVEDVAIDEAVLGSEVVLQPAPNKKYFLLSGDAAERVAPDLEKYSARYIKKYAAFRIDKKHESKVRQYLSLSHTPPITVKDQIRVTIRPAEGVTFESNGTEYDIHALYRDHKNQLWIRAQAQTQVDTQILTMPLSQLKGYADVAFDEKAVEQEVTLRPTLSIEDLESRKALKEALKESALIDADGAIYYITDSSPYGYTICESREGTTTTKGSPHPTSALSLGEAIDELVDQLSDRYLTTEREPTTQTDNNRVVTLPGAGAEPRESAASEDATKSEQKQFAFFRGETYLKIGINAEGNLLYSNAAQCRLIQLSDGSLVDELPEEKQGGDFGPPKERSGEFNTIDETLQDEEVLTNVVRLTSARSEATLSREDIETIKKIQQTVEPSRELYYQALDAYRDTLKSQDPFTDKRNEETLENALTSMATAYRHEGIDLNTTGLVEHFSSRIDDEKEHQRFFEKLIETLSDQLYNEYAEDTLLERAPQLKVEDLLSRDAEEFRAMPPAWNRHAIDTFVNREQSAQALLILANAYEGKDAIELAKEAVEVGDKEIIDHHLESFLERLEAKRKRIEIPSLIERHRARANDYAGPSPIPRTIAEEKIVALREEFARAYFDPNTIELTDELRQQYRDIPSITDFWDYLSNTYDLGPTAAKLLNENIEHRLGDLAEEEFKGTEYYALAQSVGRSLQEQWPENDRLRLCEEIGDPFLAVEIGGDDFRVSLNERHSSDGQYLLHISYGDIDDTIVYEQLPSANELLPLLDSAYYHLSSSRTDAQAAPMFGEFFNLDNPDRYHITAIAKNIRADIKAAKSAGSLPKGLKVGLRQSGYQSLNLTLKAVDDDIQLVTNEYILWHAERTENNDWHKVDFTGERHTAEGKALILALKRYLDAYNYNNSDWHQDIYDTNYSSWFYNDAEDDQLSALFEQAKAWEVAINEANGSFAINSLGHVTIDKLRTLGFAHTEAGLLRIDRSGDAPVLIHDDSQISLKGLVHPTTGLSIDTTHLSDTDVACVTAGHILSGYDLYQDKSVEVAQEPRPTEQEDLKERPQEENQASGTEAPPTAQNDTIAPSIDSENEEDEVLAGANDWRKALKSAGVLDDIKRNTRYRCELSLGDETLTVVREDFVLDIFSGEARLLSLEIDRSWDYLEVNELMPARELNMLLGALESRGVVASSAASATDKVPAQAEENSESNITGTHLVPVLPSVGRHQVIEYQNGQSYGVEVRSPAVPGQALSVSGCDSPNTALAASIKELDAVAIELKDQKNALAIVELCAIARKIERLGESGAARVQSSFLNVTRRTRVDEGGEGLLTLYRGLIEDGYQPPTQSPVITEKRLIPDSGGSDNWLYIGQFADGRYVAGCDCTIPHSGKHLVVSTDNATSSYTNKKSAIQALSKRLWDKSPFLSAALYAATDILPEIQPSLTPTPATQDSIRLSVESLSATHITVNEQEAYCVDLDSLTEQDRSLLIDSASSQAITHQQGLLIAQDLEPLQAVAETLGVELRVNSTPEQTVVDGHSNALTPTAVPASLKALGFSPTVKPGVWMLRNDQDVLITVETAPAGEDESSVDATVHLSFDGKLLTDHASLIGIENAEQALGALVLDTLQKHRAPGDLTPYPATVETTAQAISVFIENNLNLHHDSQRDQWIVSAVPATISGLIAHAGGTLTEAGKSLAFAFDENPLMSVANLMVHPGEHLSHTSTEGEYRLFVDQGAGYGKFGLYIQQIGREQLDPIVLSEHDSLVLAKLAMHTAALHQEEHENQWLNAYPEEASAHEQDESSTRGDAALDTQSAEREQPDVDGAAERSRSKPLADPGRADNRPGDGQSTVTERPGEPGRDVPPGEASPRHGDSGARGRTFDGRLFTLTEPGPETAHVEATTHALETLVALRTAGREATPQEQRVLSHCVGLGSKAFSEAFSGGMGFHAYTSNPDVKRFQQVAINLPKREQTSLRETVLTAFYTPRPITDYLWQSIETLGLDQSKEGLSVCDPALGTGHFVGAAPEYIRRTAQITGVEIDPITAEIAGHLYPEATVINRPFQEVLLEDSSTDIFIGNPPYSSVATFNPNTGKREVLHDLVLRESTRTLRPGGVIAFVTSAGTLDKTSPALRRSMHTTTDLLHALRLPTSAFEQDAGTEVMTDILIFRKRHPGEEPLSDNWVKAAKQTFEFKGEDVDVNINQYYLDNPDHVLGELCVESGPFGPRLSCHSETRIEQILKQAPAINTDRRFNPLKGASLKNAIDETLRLEVKADSLHHGEVVGNFVKTDGGLGILEYNIRTNAFEVANYKAKSKTDIALLEDYIDLRDCLKELLRLETLETNDAIEENLAEGRAALNRLYDAFIEKHGHLSETVTFKKLRNDPDAFIVSGLEVPLEQKGHYKKAETFTKRTTSAFEPLTNLEPLDAVYASMSRYGYIEPVYVSEVCQSPWEEIQEQIRNHAFKDPVSGKQVLKHIYLSGDIGHKINQAERALEHDPSMQRNLDALHSALPKRIPLEDVRIKLGASWIPDTVICEFVRHILGANNSDDRDRVNISYKSEINYWKVHITQKVLRDASTINTFEYGTNDYPFHKLIKCCLEQKTPRVTYEDPEGRRHVDEVKTQAAQDKQREIEEAFVSYIYEDPKLSQTLEEAYNKQWNMFVPLKGDGQYLSLPNATTMFRGRPFKLAKQQAAVVERAITSQYGILIAHEAGGGKTLSKAAIAMKYRQLGMASKPMAAVPNNILRQYTNNVLEAFPSARVLTVTPEDLTPEGRARFASKVRLNNWDLIICTHEQFTKMRMPAEYIESAINEEIGELELLIEETKGEDRITEKQLQRQKKGLEEKLKHEIDTADKHKDAIDFTELGVDLILYDEAHYLKNRAFPTKLSNIAGVNSVTSQRSRDAELKFDYVRSIRSDERGVVIATGTPLCNTIGEFLVMLRYTAPNLLEQAGIRHFDAFVATFGEIQTHVEITADGSGYQLKDRLSKFHNIPELMKLFTLVADIRYGEEIGFKRPDANKVSKVTQMSDQQALFMDWLQVRAKRVKDGLVRPDEDNMLKIYNDLGIMSTDPRLYHPKLDNDPKSKVNTLIDEVYKSWVNGKEENSTFLVFCDFYRKTVKVENGTDKKTGKTKYKSIELFNLYDYIVSELVERGIPKDEVRTILEADTPDEKSALYADMRAGKVRVCLASTAKMGVGAEVQTRLKDIAHLTLPMRSIDVEQRNKRGIRNGNMNSEVNLHFPTTKDSGDLGRLQMLDRKEKMISPIMSADFSNMARTIDEDFTPTYEDIMALTTGNDVIKEKVECDMQVKELERKKWAHESSVSRAKGTIAHLRLYDLIDLEKDMATAHAVAKVMEANPELHATISNTDLVTAKAIGAALHREAKSLNGRLMQRHVGQFRGFDLFLTNKDNEIYATIEVQDDKGGKIARISQKLSVNLASFVGALNARIKDRGDINQVQARIDKINNKIADLEKVAGTTFDKHDELTRLRAKQSELNVEVMKLEKNIDKDALSGTHPFEDLLARLDSEQSLLSDEAINEALTEELSETEEQPMEESFKGQVPLLL